MTFFPAIVIKTVHGFGNDSSGNMAELINQEASGIVDQYKDIIREQDRKLKEFEETVKRFDHERQSLQFQLNDAVTSNSNLSDTNILLKAQLNAASESSVPSTYPVPNQNISSQNTDYINHLENQMSAFNIDHQTQINFYQSENARLLTEIDELKQRLSDADRLVGDGHAEMEKLRKDQEDLLELLSDQDTKLNHYKQQLRSLGQPIQISDDDEDVSDDENHRAPVIAADAVVQQPPPPPFVQPHPPQQQLGDYPMVGGDLFGAAGGQGQQLPVFTMQQLPNQHCIDFGNDLK